MTSQSPITNPTQGEMLWDIFLSHNSADKKWVEGLAAQLEAEPLEDKPDSKTIRVFLDIWDIEAGENIVIKLNEGMAKSRFVALIMSPEFFRSNWTALEWTHCVAEDPRNTRGRIIPILYRDVSTDGKEAISFPAPFRALKHLDFRTPKSKKAFYLELLNRVRGLPTPRGVSRQPTRNTFPSPGPSPVVRPERWKADEVSELLISNLLPVVSSPARIWSAATAIRKTKDVYDEVESGDGVIIHGERLYTFAQLTDELCPLRKVVDVGTASDKDGRDEWLADKDKGRLYTWLLNSCLRKHLEEIGLEQDEKERFFFPPATPTSWTFSVRDFGNLPSLASRLRSPLDPVSTYVTARLTPATRQALQNYHGKKSDPTALVAGVVEDFNNILHGESIFEQERYSNFFLRPETKQLLAQQELDDSERVRLNRLLFEDAFAREILDARRVIIGGGEVTGRKPSPQPGGDFWVHSAADIRFYRIWDRFFLRIVPCFLFTHDGKTPLDGKKMGRMCIRWGGRQRNSNILRDLVFWSNLLMRGHPQIYIAAGAETVEVRPLPATARSSRGIRGDHIRFSKLMQFAPDDLEQAATDVELTPSDEDENEPPSE